MINGMSSWPPARQEMLYRLFEDGIPLSEIGLRLGVTKNAVVGFCNRNGMKRGPLGPLSEKVVNQRRLKKAVKRVEQLKSMRRRKPAAIVAAEIAVEIAALDAEIAAIPDDYTGPTSMERLQMLRDRMDEVTRESDEVMRERGRVMGTKAVLNITRYLSLL